MRVIRSNRTLTESRVKEIYIDQLNFRRSLAEDDPDAAWPALKQISDDDLANGYGWLLEESGRKNFRGIIQVVDGEVVPDEKEAKLPPPTPITAKTVTK